MIKSTKIIGIIFIIIAATAVVSTLVEQEKLISDLKQEKEKIEREAEEKYETLVATNKRLQEEVDKYDAEKKLPDVPVLISFRRPYLAMGNGYIAEIKNSSRTQISIRLVIHRPSEDRDTSEVSTIQTIRPYDVTLPAHETATLGEDEGWAFESGDTVTVLLPEHRRRIFTVL
jgi:hypothetical protein